MDPLSISTPTNGLPPLSQAPLETTRPIVREEGGEPRFTNLFTSFVQHKCPNMKLEEAQNQVKLGQRFIRQIESAETPLNHSKAEKEKNFVSFAWYLTYLAAEKGEYLANGTFVFRDPKNKIVDYFKETSCRAWSFHFKGRAVPWLPGEWLTHGCRTELGKDILPCGKNSLLFSSITMMNGSKEYGFLKCETYGTSNFYNICGRVWRFVKTSFVQNEEGLRREKNYPKKIRMLFEELLLQLPKEEQKEAKEKLDKFGLSFIYQTLDHPKLKENEMAQKLKSYLEENYPDIAEGYRTGEEVVLSSLEPPTRSTLRGIPKREEAQKSSYHVNVKLIVTLVIGILLVIGLDILFTKMGLTDILKKKAFFWLGSGALGFMVVTLVITPLIKDGVLGGAIFAAEKIIQRKAFKEFKAELENTPLYTYRSSKRVVRRIPWKSSSNCRSILQVRPREIFTERCEQERREEIRSQPSEYIEKENHSDQPTKKPRNFRVSSHLISKKEMRRSKWVFFN